MLVTLFRTCVLSENRMLEVSRWHIWRSTRDSFQISACCSLSAFKPTPCLCFPDTSPAVLLLLYLVLDWPAEDDPASHAADSWSSVLFLMPPCLQVRSIVWTYWRQPVASFLLAPMVLWWGQQESSLRRVCRRVWETQINANVKNQST